MKSTGNLLILQLSYDATCVINTSVSCRYLALEKMAYTNRNPYFHSCPRPSPDGQGCPGEGELEEGMTQFVCPICLESRFVFPPYHVLYLGQTRTMLITASLNSKNHKIHREFNHSAVGKAKGKFC